MADINITQAEADALIALEKVRADDKEWLFPHPGGRLAMPLTSTDKREAFVLTLTRVQIQTDQGLLSKLGAKINYPNAP